MKYTLATLLLAISAPTYSQDFSQVLSSIERHSLHLQAAQETAKGEKTESNLEVTLPDPELGLGYLFGPDGYRRYDVSVSQGFDFPTVIHQKRKLTRLMQQVSELNYLSERQKVLTAARKLCVEVVFCNAMLAHLQKDVKEAKAISSALDILFKQGEATIVDRNKVHQGVLLYEAMVREYEMMKVNALGELQVMNGGEAVSITDSVFVHQPLPQDFNLWLKENLQRHPDMRLSDGEVQSKAQGVKAAKAQWAPGLKVGYMAELDKEEKLHGPTLGLSLPLWGTSKKVKASKQYLKATELERKEMELKLTAQLRNAFNEVKQLEKTYTDMKSHQEHCDVTALLKTSVENGQITILNFLDELQYAHEIHEKILTTERDMELRKAELCF